MRFLTRMTLIVCCASGLLSSPKADETVPQGAPSDQIEHHLVLSFHGGFAVGYYSGASAHAISYLASLPFGAGIRYRRAAVTATVAVGGVHITNTYYDLPDATVEDSLLSVRFGYFSLELDYSLISNRSWRVTPALGIQWHAYSYDRTFGEDVSIDNSRNRGVVAKVCIDYSLARRGWAGDTERAHHWFSLSFQYAGWSFDQLGVGDGGLWTIALSYTLDLVIW